MEQKLMKSDTNIFLLDHRRRLVLGLATFWLFTPFFQAPVVGQTVRLSFADPSRMLEEMFGEDRPEDREALEKIEVSIEEERQLGQQMVQDALAMMKASEIRVETTGRDVEYLQSLVATLQPSMRNKHRDKTIRVMLARSPRIDARSYPGGTLMFFDGLLDAVENEAALVGIVGHELSHLDRGHQLLPIKRLKLMEKSFSSPRDLMQFMPGKSGMAKLWARPFRPEDERDADRDGVAWSYAAGYDPRELAKLFQKLGAKSSGAEEMPWSTFFRSHPYNHEREEAIQKQFSQNHKKKSKPAPLFIGQENLANRKSRKQVGE
jgi:predicted Zn-dependent protease